MNPYFKLFTGLLFLFNNELLNASTDIALSRSVVKILVLSDTGKLNMGSGVVIGRDKIATNCHVTRKAKRVYLIKEDKQYPVLAQAAIPDLDVCILKTEVLALPVVSLANSKLIKIDDNITIYSYPYALGIRMLKGKVNGLHAFKQDKIIEINAGFTHGASGGGVFNHAGELMGLITFMGQHNDGKHFYAIPASWVTMAKKARFKPIQVIKTLSFWEQGRFKHRFLQ